MRLSRRNLLPALAAAVLAVTAQAAGTAWGVEYFPNIPLVDQDGKPARFFDDLIKDKVVAINFMFTSCADACPLETARLRQVQEILGERVGKDIFMYSISIDPVRDQPAVLKAYAAKYQTGPGWSFYTGRKEDITRLRTRLGLLADGLEAAKLKNHRLTMIIGNQATGQWMKASPYENPYILADQLGSWLHNWKTPNPNQVSYAQAPKLRTVSKGEDLFRTRCAACHTLGDTGVRSARKELGPDLLYVTRRRDRDWLDRWIAEPDKMIAAKDPVAIALLGQYDNVPMPNLRLSRDETEQICDYLEEETRRVEALRSQAKL